MTTESETLKYQNSEYKKQLEQRIKEVEKLKEEQKKRDKMAEDKLALTQCKLDYLKIIMCNRG